MLSQEQMAIVATSVSPVTTDISLIRNWFVMPVYREMEQAYSLTEPEISALTWIGNSPGLYAADIVAITTRPKNTVSRSLKILLKKGLIKRAVDPKDQRQKALNLTAAGEKIYRYLAQRWIAEEKRFTALFSEAELGFLKSLLDRATQQLVFSEDAQNGDGKAQAGK